MKKLSKARDVKIHELLEAGSQAHGDEFYAPIHDILFPNEPKWEKKRK